MLNLGKTDHQRLTILIHGTQYTISVLEAATLLQLPKGDAAKCLAILVKAGWLSRVRRGVYLPYQGNVIADDTPLYESWVLAKTLFQPCYVGGMAAAHHWNMVDKYPEQNYVFTTRRPRNRHPKIMRKQYSIRTVAPDAMFGLQPASGHHESACISDPSRTMIDFLIDPSLAGGIHEVIGIFKKYLKSNHRDLKLLFDYARRLYNGAVLKRLGFLLERLAPEARDITMLCKYSITTGYVKLDPKLDAEKLITRWNLWVPDELDIIL
tara:strand:+ start:2370 stop:3167 length:798 start_codon:yes stop_codon:yes gene_type:complete